MSGFFEELQRRKVYRVAIAYIVASWALAQGLAQVLPVFDISNSVILPQEAEKMSPVKLAEPAYVLDVAIQRQSVRVGGEHEAALRPDMLLTATIETDKKSVLAWIGESVFGVAQR